MIELSKAIKISRPTLSKFFDTPSLLRPSTVDAINKKLNEVDYVYNFISTRQNRQTSNLIGVVLPTYNDQFYTALLTSIVGEAKKNNKTVIMQSSDSTVEGEINSISYLRSMAVDGAIIASIGNPDVNETLKAATNDFPISFVDSLPNQLIKNTDFIGTDNNLSIGSIVEYLCQTGLPPVFLNMPMLNSNAVLRKDAYVKKMNQLGHKPTIISLPEVQHNWEFEEFGFQVMNYHFTRQNYTNDTILCANDRIAIGVIRAANKNKIFQRKNNFRIAGHDNHPLSKFVFPQLTTAGQDIPRIAQGAVQMLMERIKGVYSGKSRKVYPPSVLKIRKSSE